MKTTRFFQFFVIMSLVLMTLSPISVSAQSSQVLYAVQGGLTSGTCDSWANACELQYALTSAVSDQEIWVAAGVYKPGTARTDTFQLKSGVGLYGGFVGSETARDQRNWENNKTVLSGDIDNNDINDDGNFIAETTADIQGENSYHVVMGSSTDNTAMLDGFIVNAGQTADGGGGMYNYVGSPTISNITFSANLASGGAGGGLFNWNSSPIITDVTFHANLASSGGGMANEYYSNPTLTNVIFSANSAGQGGGITNSTWSNPTLMNVIFYDNSATGSYSNGRGGGIYNGGNPTLTNVTFFANSADQEGGGMYNEGFSKPNLTNVTFFANSANAGGGMYNYQVSSPILMNVTFFTNSAVLGGGMMISGTGYTSASTTLTNVTFFANSAEYGGGIFFQGEEGTLTVINSILWGNSASDGSGIYNYYTTPIISYSDVQGGWPGTGNIDADPLFVGPADGDLHLQAGSPAIDSGTNDGCPPTDFDGVVRPQDGNGDGIATCDMGAFEFPAPPVSNDNFASAKIVPLLPFDDIVDITTASLEADEPNSSCAWYGSLWKTVWYAYTPSTDEVISASVPEAAFAPVLTVYTGNSLAELTQLGCQVFSENVLTIPVNAGTTYYFQVGKLTSWDPDGELRFHVERSENLPPVAEAGSYRSVPEGYSINLNASRSYDPEGYPLIYEWDLNNDGEYDDATGMTTIVSFGDNGNFTIGLRVTDDGGLIDTDTATITFFNLRPTVGTIIAPVDPVRIGALVNASASFIDPGFLDTHTAVWDWGDGVTSEGVVDGYNVSGQHVYNAPGVYTLTLTVQDDDGGVGSATFEYIVVYDPSSGFVTGSGWIWSPEGVYTPDPSLTGKATFGFVSKYQKGANVPTGDTEFHFNVADFHFESTSYDWLVIAGTKAQFKGTGTINGTGEYKFLLTAIDGSPDMFRIKIWDKETGETIYDNQLGSGDISSDATELGGGSIVIHKPK